MASELADIYDISRRKLLGRMFMKHGIYLPAAMLFIIALYALCLSNAEAQFVTGSGFCGTKSRAYRERVAATAEARCLQSPAKIQRVQERKASADARAQASLQRMILGLDAPGQACAQAMDQGSLGNSTNLTPCASIDNRAMGRAFSYVKLSHSIRSKQELREVKYAADVERLQQYCVDAPRLRAIVNLSNQVCSIRPSENQQ
jgi:hypothetical protein